MVANIESMIWDRAIDPDWTELSPDVAEAILRIRFKEADVRRMNDLAALGAPNNPGGTQVMAAKAFAQ